MGQMVLKYKVLILMLLQSVDKKKTGRGSYRYTSPEAVIQLDGGLQIIRILKNIQFVQKED
jgi:hypothetical protein